MFGLVRTRPFDFFASSGECPARTAQGSSVRIKMDFDHRDPSVKSFGLTTARAMLASREDLMREVAKCDVVCANCHRRRTAPTTRHDPRCSSAQ